MRTTLLRSLSLLFFLLVIFKTELVNGNDRDSEKITVELIPVLSKKGNDLTKSQIAKPEIIPQYRTRESLNMNLERDINENIIKVDNSKNVSQNLESIVVNSGSPKKILTVPAFGPTSGGIWVQVVGAGSYMIPNSIQCKLDMIEQFCYSNHYYYTWCYTTPKCSGVYTMACHNGPLEFEGKYAVVAKVPVVTSVYPFAGDSTGGTPVTVRGWNFEAHCPKQLLCKFGSQIVRGKFYSSSTIMCISPCAIKKGFVSVEVSNDGGVHWSSTGVQFGYVGTELELEERGQCKRYLAIDQIIEHDQGDESVVIEQQNKEENGNSNQSIHSSQL